MKTLYLYTQGEKESIEEYGRNFKSLWDTVEAFGGSPGVHNGLVEGILKDPGRVRNVNSITDAECRAAEQEVAVTLSRQRSSSAERTSNDMGNSKMSWQRTIFWGQTNTPTRLTRRYASLGTIKQAG